MRRSSACSMYAVAVLAVLACASAHAQEVFRPGIDCQCRGPHGQLYNLEEKACLRSDNGDRIATCVMNQNVTSWQFSNQSCEVSERQDRGGRSGWMSARTRPANATIFR